jgi:hypothetical protein
MRIGHIPIPHSLIGPSSLGARKLAAGNMATVGSTSDSRLWRQHQPEGDGGSMRFLVAQTFQVAPT